MRLRQLFSARFWSGGDRSWYGSLGVSMFVHVCIIVLLGSLWTFAPGPAPVPGVETRWSPAETVIQPITVDPVDPLPSSLQQDAGGRRPDAAVRQHQPTRSLQVQGPVADTAELSQFVGNRWGTDDLAEDVGELPGHGDTVGSGIGDGEGDGFFGIPLEGRRIVYVVDCSRSMNHPHPSEAKTRFRRLKFELIQSIGNMDSDMEFFIIYFNHEAIPMPARTMQPALPAVKKKYLEWAAQVQADGKTDPRDALSIALRLQPDVIYFLTDGSFKHRIELDLLELKQDRITIHTFCMAHRGGEEILKAVAAANGGKYHFVP